MSEVRRAESSRMIGSTVFATLSEATRPSGISPSVPTRMGSWRMAVSLARSGSVILTTTSWLWPSSKIAPTVWPASAAFTALFTASTDRP